MKYKTDTGVNSTGHHSTGDWSISDYSTGHFSTKDYTGFGAFNHPCSVTVWGAAKKPFFLYAVRLTRRVEGGDVAGVELKTIPYKAAWAKAWEGRDEADLEKLLALPNFDAAVFQEISGIDIYEDSVNIKLRQDLAELKAKVKEMEDDLGKQQ